MKEVSAETGKYLQQKAVFFQDFIMIYATVATVQSVQFIFASF